MSEEVWCVSRGFDLVGNVLGTRLFLIDTLTKWLPLTARNWV